MTNKGSIFEDFTETLLNSVKGFTVRYKRAKARAKPGILYPKHDYDLIVHNESIVFPEFGNYILVECKNRNEPIGYPAIANFLHKVHSRKCKTGFILAMKNVVYGRFNPTIKRTFDQDGIAIIVIDQKDLQEVVLGRLLLTTLLRKKYEEVRFGVINK